MPEQHHSWPHSIVVIISDSNPARFRASKLPSEGPAFKSQWGHHFLPFCGRTMTSANNSNISLESFDSGSISSYGFRYGLKRFDRMPAFRSRRITFFEVGRGGIVVKGWPMRTPPLVGTLASDRVFVPICHRRACLCMTTNVQLDENNFPSPEAATAVLQAILPPTSDERSSQFPQSAHHVTLQLRGRYRPLRR